MREATELYSAEQYSADFQAAYALFKQARDPKSKKAAKAAEKQLEQAAKPSSATSSSASAGGSSKDPFAAYFYVLLRFSQGKAKEKQVTEAFSLITSQSSTTPKPLLPAMWCLDAYGITRSWRDGVATDIPNSIECAKKYEITSPSLTHGMAHHLSAVFALSQLTVSGVKNEDLDAIFLDIRAAAGVGFDYEKLVRAHDPATAALIKKGGSEQTRPVELKKVLPDLSEIATDRFSLDPTNRAAVTRSQAWAHHYFALQLMQRGMCPQAAYYLTIAQHQGVDYTTLNDGFWKRLLDRSWPQLRADLFNALIRYKGKGKPERQAVCRQMLQLLINIDQDACGDAGKMQRVISELLPLVVQVSQIKAGKAQKAASAASSVGVVKAQISQVSRDCLAVLERYCSISTLPQGQLSGPCRTYVTKEVKKSTEKLYQQVFPYVTYTVATPASGFLRAVAAIESLSERQAQEHCAGQAITVSTGEVPVAANIQVAIQAVADHLSTAMQHPFDVGAYLEQIKFRGLVARLTSGESLRDGDSFIDTALLDRGPMTVSSTAPSSSSSSSSSATSAAAAAAYAPVPDHMGERLTIWFLFGKGLYKPALERLYKLKCDRFSGFTPDGVEGDIFVSFDNPALAWPAIRDALLQKLIEYGRENASKRRRMLIRDAMLDKLIAIDAKTGITDAEKIRLIKHVSRDLKKQEELKRQLKSLKKTSDPVALEAAKTALRDEDVGILDLVVVNNKDDSLGQAALGKVSTAGGVSDLSLGILDVYVDRLAIHRDPSCFAAISQSAPCRKYVEERASKTYQHKDFLAACILYIAEVRGETAKSPPQPLIAVTVVGRYTDQTARIDCVFRVVQEYDEVRALDEEISLVERSLLLLAEKSFNFAAYMDRSDVQDYLGVLQRTGKLGSTQVILSYEHMQLGDMSTCAYKYVSNLPTGAAIQRSKAFAHFCLAMALFGKGLYASGLRQLYKMQAIDPQTLEQFPVCKALLSATFANKVKVGGSKSTETVTVDCGWTSVRDQLFDALVKYSSTDGTHGPEREKKCFEIFSRLCAIDQEDISAREKIRKVLAEFPRLAIELGGIGYSKRQSMGALVGSKQMSRVSKDILRILVYSAGLIPDNVPIIKGLETPSTVAKRYVEEKSKEVNVDVRGDPLYAAARPYLSTAIGTDEQTTPNTFMQAVLEIERIGRAQEIYETDNTKRATFMATTGVDTIPSETLQALVAVDAHVVGLETELSTLLDGGFDFRGFIQQPQLVEASKAILAGKLSGSDTRFTFLPTSVDGRRFYAASSSAVSSASAVSADVGPVQRAYMHLSLALYLERCHLHFAAEQQLQKARDLGLQETVAIPALAGEVVYIAPGVLAAEVRRMSEHLSGIPEEPILGSEKGFYPGENAKKLAGGLLTQFVNKLKSRLTSNDVVFYPQFAEITQLAYILVNSLPVELQQALGKVTAKQFFIINNLPGAILGKLDLAELGISVQRISGPNYRLVINYDQFVANIDHLIAPVQEYVDEQQKKQEQQAREEAEEARDPTASKKREILKVAGEMASEVYAPFACYCKFIFQHMDKFPESVRDNFKREVIPLLQRLSNFYDEKIKPLEQNIIDAVGESDCDQVCQAVIALLDAPEYKEFYRMMMLCGLPEVMQRLIAVSPAFKDVQSDSLTSALAETLPDIGTVQDAIQNCLSHTFQKPLKIGLFLRDLVFKKDSADGHIVGIDGLIGRVFGSDHKHFAQLHALYVEYEQLTVSFNTIIKGRAEATGKVKEKGFEGLSAASLDCERQYPNCEALLAAASDAVEQVRQTKAAQLADLQQAERVNGHGAVSSAVSSMMSGSQPTTYDTVIGPRKQPKNVGSGNWDAMPAPRPNVITFFKGSTQGEEQSEEKQEEQVVDLPDESSGGTPPSPGT